MKLLNYFRLALKAFTSQKKLFSPLILIMYLNKTNQLQRKIVCLMKLWWIQMKKLVLAFYDVTTSSGKRIFVMLKWCFPFGIMLLKPFYISQERRKVNE